MKACTLLITDIDNTGMNPTISPIATQRPERLCVHSSLAAGESMARTSLRCCSSAALACSSAALTPSSRPRSSACLRLAMRSCAGEPLPLDEGEAEDPVVQIINVKQIDM